MVEVRNVDLSCDDEERARSMSKMKKDRVGSREKEDVDVELSRARGEVKPRGHTVLYEALHNKEKLATGRKGRVPGERFLCFSVCGHVLGMSSAGHFGR